MRGVAVSRTPSRAVARVIAAVAIAAAVGSGLVACTSEPPGPQQAAATLAAALSSGSFAKVVFTGPTTPADAATARAAAYEGLGDRAPEVVVKSAKQDADDEDSATATLAFTWDLDPRGAGDEWRYTTTVHLERDAADESVWQTAWRSALLAPDLAPDETLTLTRERARRAEVLGADDEPIVEPRPVHRIGVDKTRVAAGAQDAAARGLAAALDLDAEEYAARVAAAGPKAFVEAIVVRDGDKAYDIGALAALPGVNAVADSLPLAPTRTFARAILGTVGDATAEAIEKSDGAIVAGDLTGLSGLQRQYDAQLRGRAGLEVEARNPDGSAKRVLFRTDPVAGQPLRTTLDLGLQLSAEQILAGVGPASAIVAIQPSTGNVLAAASGAGGDGMATATLGQYAPGSTFKVVSALALLRSGLTPSSTVACPPSVVVDGRTFNNFPDYPAARLGAIPLATAFAHSCNTAFISQREAAPQSALIDAAGSLGLTSQDLGFSAFLGAVPADSDGTDHAATMIGQGRVLASPLGMATVAASVAHGGTVTPRLVVNPPADGATPSPTGDASQDDDASSPAEGDDEAPARAHVDLTGDEAAQLRELMRGVVTVGGASFLGDVPGDPVLAKTGTAQFGPADNLQNHVWMIAVHGDLAVAVFVDVGEYGSTTAGPLLERFLRAAG